MDEYNDNVRIDEQDLLDAHEEATKKEKSRSLIYCGVIMLITALLVTIIVLANKNNKLSNKLSKQEATETINGVVITVINTNDFTNVTSNNNSSDNNNDVYNLTESQLNDVYLVFNAFDEDNDDLLSIEEHFEYIFYNIRTAGGRSNTSIFKKADIDNDDVISFRELVYITTLLNQSYETASTMTKNYLNNILIPTAIKGYGLENIIKKYNNDSSINFNIFEYVAALIMAKYDTNNNGYVTYEVYVLSVWYHAFKLSDTNEDDLISFEEFINGTFGIQGLSFISLLTTDTESSLGVDGTHKNITLDSFIISDIINLEVDKEVFLSGNVNNDGNGYYKLYQCPNMNLANETYGLNRYYGINSNGGTTGGTSRRRNRRRLMDPLYWSQLEKEKEEENQESEEPDINDYPYDFNEDFSHHCSTELYLYCAIAGWHLGGCQLLLTTGWC